MDKIKVYAWGIISVLIVLTLAFSYLTYTEFRIDVPQGNIAVLTKRTGKDLNNDQLVAPDNSYKGIQLKVLTEGRYFYNPYAWDWEVYPMIDIPSDKMGVRTRLFGQNLPYGHFLAIKEDQKGIVEQVLRPGRYPLNAVIYGEENRRAEQNYVEIVELHDPVTIPAGYRGVVTNLAGPIPENPNTLLVEKTFRGVQSETLDAGTYYLNPYMYRINIVDCRSQRFNLSDNYEMGFASKDGFWVSLDGIIEFRIKPERAPEVFVIYNDLENDTAQDSSIHEEIVSKIIMPTARSFCRLRGSNNSGRDFIGGETRTAFQKDFATAMHEACDKNGVEIVQALITKINPPQEIAGPVRDREVARQKMHQYQEQTKQQEQEAKLAIEAEMVNQKTSLVEAEKSVIESVTKSIEKQKVAVTKVNELKAVAEKDLEASKDVSEANLAKKRAEAGSIAFKNEAEAFGWKKSIEAFNGDGNAFAKYVLYQKLAPAYKSIMNNSVDSPLMKIFDDFNKKLPSQPIQNPVPVVQ